MTNQPSMESSLAARIQKIAADLQSGVLPSTTENIMHLMGLKSDLEKARSARSAQMLMQPKAPTVKDQLLAGAQQEAGIASLPEYADGGVVGYYEGGPVIGPVSKRVAKYYSEMPTSYTGVFGLNDPMFPEGESQGLSDIQEPLTPSARLYASDLNERDAAALAVLTPEQKNYYAALPNGTGAAIAAGRKILAERPTQRYRNVLPTEDVTAPQTTNVPYFRSEAAAPKGYSSDMPEMQALTKKILGGSKREEAPQQVNPPRYRNILPTEDVTTRAKGLDLQQFEPTQVSPKVVTQLPTNLDATKLPESVDNKQPTTQQYDAYAGVESPTRPKQPTTQQPATRQQVEAKAAKDMMQQQAKKTQGELAGKPGVGSFVVAPKEKTATQALIEEATRDTSAQPAAPAMPAIPSLQSGMEEWQKAVGENKGIGATEERLRKLEAGTADTKDRALWEGLMMAGLQRAGGANWGQAGMAGLGTWSEAQKEARKQEEKYFTIQNELEQAKRNELIQAAQYGGKARENALQRAAELEKEQFRAAAEMKQTEMRAKANISAAQIYANRPTGGAGSLAEERYALTLRKYETAMLNSAIDDTQKQLDSGLRNTIGFKDTPKYAELTNKLNNLNAQRDAMMSGAPTPSPADQPGQKLSAEQRAAMEKSVQAKLLR